MSGQRTARSGEVRSADSTERGGQVSGQHGVVRARQRTARTGEVRSADCAEW